MADTNKTVYLPNRWPVTISLDEWKLLGEAKTDDSSNVGQAQKPPQLMQAVEYSIEVYQKDGQYLVAGHRSETRRRDPHDTGRLVKSQDTVIPAVEAVVAELSNDAERQRSLVQRLITDLPPVPFT